MKKYIFLFSLALLLSANAFSQTKKIAHRSHSGKMKHFSIAGSDNFGLSPHYESIKSLSTAKPDSIAAKPLPQESQVPASTGNGSSQKDSLPAKKAEPSRPVPPQKANTAPEKRSYGRPH